MEKAYCNWHTRSTGALMLEILLGMVYILAGVFLLINPVASLVSLTLTLTVSQSHVKS